MRLDGTMIHTRACMQWCAYYTWEALHTDAYQIGSSREHWLTLFLDRWKKEVMYFDRRLEVQCIYLQELSRITFNIKPTRAAESYSVYICLDKPLKEAIWARRYAPYDPSLKTGEQTWGIDELFQGFDYRHLNEEPIGLEQA